MMTLALHGSQVIPRRIVAYANLGEPVATVVPHEAESVAHLQLVVERGQLAARVVSESQMKFGGFACPNPIGLNMCGGAPLSAHKHSLPTGRRVKRPMCANELGQSPYRGKRRQHYAGNYGSQDCHDYLDWTHTRILSTCMVSEPLGGRNHPIGSRQLSVDAEINGTGDPV